MKALRSLVVVIAVVARGRDLCTDRDFGSGCYRRILLQRVAVVAVVPVTFFSRRKETCTRTMGHEVGIVALVVSRVERPFLRTLTKTVAVVAESRWTCTRTVIQDGCRR